MARIILASKSSARAGLLTAAGVDFAAMSPHIDERAIETPLAAAGRSPAEIALALAEAKALAIGGANRDALVIGADQTLDLDGRQFHKPATLAEARAQLAALAGRSHKLHSAVAGVRAGAVTWRVVESVTLTLRPLSAAEIDTYLARVCTKALQSVGAYQIEGPAIQLFDRIDGDYFAILGLPLLPVLKWLRDEGALG